LEPEALLLSVLSERLDEALERELRLEETDDFLLLLLLDDLLLEERLLLRETLRSDFLEAGLLAFLGATGFLRESLELFLLSLFKLLSLD
jgi:hypothetical protein